MVPLTTKGLRPLFGLGCAGCGLLVLLAAIWMGTVFTGTGAAGAFLLLVGSVKKVGVGLNGITLETHDSPFGSKKRR